MSNYIYLACEGKNVSLCLAISLGVMSFKRTSSREHKERSQPKERAKFGLLEKKKDYKLRTDVIILDFSHLFTFRQEKKKSKRFLNYDNLLN
jgi:hypothetical protein